jgi:hypothetical protein
MRFPVILALAALLGVSAFAEDRNLWRTASEVTQGVRGSIVGNVTDINAGRNQFTIIPDQDNNGSLLVTADAVSTQYSGFGGVINDKPEIYVGSTGFPNIRLGDRVEVRGVGAGSASVRADVVTLLGRNLPATQVGVGSTRQAGQITTPTASVTSPNDRLGTVEGVVRQVSASNYNLVLETDRRQMITVRGTSSTPVYFRGDTFRIRNIEVGDRIRIEPETTSSTNDLRARSIEVLQSVGDAPTGGTTTNRSVASISGRVTRVDRSTDMIRIDTGRGETRVDLATALDPGGQRVRAADVQVGDQVEVSGAYGATSDFLIASTVRFGGDVLGNPVPTGSGTIDVPANRNAELVSVTIYGSVTESLRTAPQLTVRESQTGRSIRLWVHDDLPVRARTGSTYVTADTLKEGDNVTIKAYRDADGNYIAQVMRLRP